MQITLRTFKKGLVEIDNDLGTSQKLYVIVVR